MRKLLWWALNYRPGSLFWIVTFLLVFLTVVMVTQYQMTGKVDLWAAINHDSDRKYFWDRNPNLEYADSYPHTSLVLVRDRQSGRTAMVDLFVAYSALIQTAPCEAEVYAGATEAVCFRIQKPDSDNGAYVYATSFIARAKDSQLGTFFRELFTSRGLKVTVMENSSRAVILEGDDEHDTVARVAVRDGHVFFAVADAYRTRGRPEK